MTEVLSFDLLVEFILVSFSAGHNKGQVLPTLTVTQIKVYV